MKLSAKLNGAPVELLDAGDPSVFAFRRAQGGDAVTVLVNLGAAPRQALLSGQRLGLVGWGWEVVEG